MKNGDSQLQSVQRVAALLRLLVANNRTGLRLVDFLRTIDIRRSTCHRLLQSLVAERMTMQDISTKVAISWAWPSTKWGWLFRPCIRATYASHI